jgi:hypothetical protein
MVKKGYEAPVVRVVGSLQELTLAVKNLNETPDGFVLGGQVLGTS